MKKITLIIGIGLLCSCSMNQNTDELNNKILKLEMQIESLNNDIDDLYADIEQLREGPIDCGPQNK